MSMIDNFGGVLLRDGDDGYDDGRSVFNSMIDRRPVVIAQCESVDDVRAALAHANDSGLEVAVRSGGHSVVGASSVDGGLVIDMRRMNRVEVDPDARTATVGGGATWADFDRATQPHAAKHVGEDVGAHRSIPPAAPRSSAAEHRQRPVHGKAPKRTSGQM